MTESHLRLTPKETDIIGLRRKIDLAKGIIEKGGRPSIVRAVCQVSKASALQFHKEIHGKRPKAGQLPYDPEWIIKSPQNCLHASIYFNIYKMLSKTKNLKSSATEDASNHITKGEIFLSAYTLYEEVVGDSPKLLTINRAWHIGQQVTMSYIGGKTCSCCKSTFVSIQNYPDIYKLCPLCNSTRDTLGRKKWKFPQIDATNKVEFDIYSKYIFHSEAI
ncbi:FlhC family transcriptional regulator [Methylicorpusculum sp.]|uniref:FlhC family transcriptional regulator n=2 Tax=Methylicorpusculum sp. TaxID=2713644 RepID=UPI00271C5699|nr:FlhC family transcriptional regulator [Methylicorpusculum sp.]MDO9241300.1 FlhC family transcriptional regulator [Methylicorpusculum sp.]MDP2178598.1 FlhC family transcriptional regulator [Methylicorpusculum sp.]MDP3531321.1 FlhC family transcriptional regulator [Methylicorpusculum sp.]